MVDLSELVDDGDTVELGDGRSLRLRIMPDDTDAFEEYDCYGLVEPVDTHRQGYSVRPSGFDGNSEKMWLQQNNGYIWWQPPKEGPKRGTVEFTSFKQHVNDIASFGMCVLVVEVCQGVDGYNRPIVTNVGSLGGIEPFPTDEYKAEIIGDIVAELGVL